MSQAAQLAADVLMGRRTIIRQMRCGDILLPEWECGFEQLGRIDPEWVWVAEKGGRLIGCIVASPAHGTAIVWRVVSDGSCLLPLLRTFYRDIRKRGCMGYMTIVDPRIKEQAKLQKVMERGKGGIVADGFTLIAAPVLEGMCRS